MWPECLEFSSQVSWKQVVRSDVQNLGEDEKLQIGDTPILRFQSGD
jgi:hypothetical protein